MLRKRSGKRDAACADRERVGPASILDRHPAGAIDDDPLRRLVGIQVYRLRGDNAANIEVGDVKSARRRRRIGRCGTA